MKSKAWLWVAGLVGFGLVGAPVFAGAAMVVGPLYAGPLAFGAAWSVFRVVSGPFDAENWWRYHLVRPRRTRMLDGLLVGLPTVGAGLGVTLALDATIGPVSVGDGDQFVSLAWLAVMMFTSTMVIRYRARDVLGAEASVAE